MSELDVVPPEIEVADVAKACGRTTKQQRRILQRAGIAVKIGGRWVVTDERLRERLESTYTRVHEYFSGLARKAQREPVGDREAHDSTAPKE